MTPCLIRQPAGIGDILFCQKIADKMRNKNYEIWWPIHDEISWIKDHISNINFCSINDNFPLKQYYYQSAPVKSDEGVFLPLQDADQYYTGMCMMDAKYKFIGLEYDDWSSYLKFSRNSNKEIDLIRNKLRLSGKFTLVNRKFGSPPNEQICKHINTNNLSNVVELQSIPGVSLFDWCKVFEEAHEIHTVDTSILYILETLDITDKLYCYSRLSPPTFVNVSHLFSKDWTYVS
tara:strand:- start:1713 stop:2411 length:699 start_codon:yes stop_codon:yes gene_type:complete